METVRYTVDIEEPRSAFGRPSLHLASRMHFNIGSTFGNGDSLLEVDMSTDAEGKPWGSLELSLTNYTSKSFRTTHKSLNRDQVTALRDWCNRALKVQR